MFAVWRLYARRERDVNTLQKLIARRSSVMDVIKTLLQRQVHAVLTLCGRFVHDITGKFDAFRRTSRQPYSALTGFQNVVQTLQFRNHGMYPDRRRLDLCFRYWPAFFQRRIKHASFF